MQVILKVTVYNFINSMIKESKYCSQVMKKRFNRKLVMAREDDKILRSLLNLGSVIMLKLMVMLRYYATF